MLKMSVAKKFQKFMYWTWPCCFKDKRRKEFIYIFEQKSVKLLFKKGKINFKKQAWIGTFKVKHGT